MPVRQTDGDLENDVQTIRQILFGEQLHSIKVQIDSLGEAIAALQNETRLLRQALETEEKTRHKESNTLEMKLENTKVLVLQQLSDEFATHLKLHEELVTSLASALLKYSEHTGTTTEST